MAPKIVDKDEKRRCIAMAAVEVFGDKGYERTRIDDIAERAGIGKGTVYEYFSNKEELLDGALRELLSQMANAIMPSADQSRSPVATLKEVSRRTIEAMDRFGGTYRFFLEYMLYASRRGENYGELEDLLGVYRQGLAALIDEGKAAGEFRDDIDSFEAAAAIAAWFDGAIFHVMVLPGTVSLKVLEQRFMELILHGLIPSSCKS